MFWLHCQVYLGKTTCYLLLTSLIVEFELPKQAQKNPRGSKVMIGNVIGASDTEAGLGKNCLVMIVGNSTLMILTCSSDLGHGFTMILVVWKPGRFQCLPFKVRFQLQPKRELRFCFFSVNI